MYRTLRLLVGLLTFIAATAFTNGWALDNPGYWKSDVRECLVGSDKVLVVGIISAHPREQQGLVDHMTGAVEEKSFGNRTYRRGMLWGIDSIVTTSRVGKVAAAITATQMIAEFDVDFIIFMGVAGGMDPDINVGDMVVANALVQHDIDSRPWTRQCEIPLLNVKELCPDEYLGDLCVMAAESFIKDSLDTAMTTELKLEMRIGNPKVICGVIASGDRFVSSEESREIVRALVSDVKAVEMEGAAVAQVAFEYDVPCAVIRTISDAANEDAGIDCFKFMYNVAPIYTTGVLMNLYQLLHEEIKA